MDTQEILSNADNISLNTTTDNSKLCELWPGVKEGLQLLADIIKNPIVKISINAIIAAGDAIIGKICA